MKETRPYWEGTVPGPIRIGSTAHKELFCRMLLDTFEPYTPAAIDWPDLSAAARERLMRLPFWDIAVATEGNAALRMQTIADETTDALLKAALALNAFEERRHKAVIQTLLCVYGIDVGPEPQYIRPSHAEWAYIRTGYGECFDSFFAFGLFELASEAGFFPPELVKVFEPVMQEEARHILFFVNWVAYTRAHMPVWQRPTFVATCLVAAAMQARERLQLARQGASTNGTMTQKGHESLGIEISLRAFMDRCLHANDRRMRCYDTRLVRPQMVPRLVRMLRPLAGRLAS
jgi:hypothetical protein